MRKLIVLQFFKCSQSVYDSRQKWCINHNDYTIIMIVLGLRLQFSVLCSDASTYMQLHTPSTKDSFTFLSAPEPGRQGAGSSAWSKVEQSFYYIDTGCSLGTVNCNVPFNFHIIIILASFLFFLSSLYREVLLLSRKTCNKLNHNCAKARAFH